MDMVAKKVKPVTVQIRVPDVFRDFADFLEDPEKVLGKERAEQAKKAVDGNDPRNQFLMKIVQMMRAYVHGVAGVNDASVWRSQQEIEDGEQQGQGSETSQGSPSQSGESEEGRKRGQEATTERAG